MDREQLAEKLYETAQTVDDRPDWDTVGPFPRSVALAVADRALALLSGPRTGEELYRTLERMGAALDAVHRDWDAIDPDEKAAFDAVARTFTAPPEPVGWPEGWGIANGSPIDPSTMRGRWRAAISDGFNIMAWVDGATKEEAEHRARLIAWTLANQRPATWPDQVEHHWKLRAERAEEEAARRQGQIVELSTALEQERATNREHAQCRQRQNEWIADLAKQQKDSAVNLASHLSSEVRHALLVPLITLSAQTAEVSPEQVGDAFDDADACAALLLRVKAV